MSQNKQSTQLDAQLDAQVDTKVDRSLEFLTAG